MAKTCDVVDLSNALTLLWKSKCNGQLVEIDPDSLPNVNDANVCEALEGCETIQALRAKDKQLEDKDRNIDKALDELRESQKENSDHMDQIDEDIESQNQVLEQVNTEISWLKTDYIRVINKIKALWRHVILDDHFKSFEAWVENVYIPNAWADVNQYKEGTWYFNTNPSIDADTSAYINIRKEWDTSPYSINDWYRLPYNLPALAIIWIDPVKVVHPYKWRFEVSLDANKLADFISKLDHLDLSQVKLYLGDVYLDWVIKESLHIQEDLTVDNTINTQNLNVSANADINHLHATEWQIETHHWPERFLDDVSMNAALNVDWPLNALSVTAINAVNGANANITNTVNAWTVNATNWHIQNHTGNESFNGNIDVAWTVSSVNANVTATLTAHDVHATDHLTVDNAATFVIAWKDLNSYLREFCDARYVLK